MEHALSSFRSVVPQVAVFDVDETLIRVKSMFEFLEFALQNHEGLEAGAAKAASFVAELRKTAETKPRAEVNRDFYRYFKGWSADEVRQLARDWFATVNTATFYHPEVLRRFKEHRNLGHHTVFLSGSAELFLVPLAAFLKVDDLIAIHLEEDAFGRLTGEIEGIQTIGVGKKRALMRVIEQMGRPLEIYGYGDHASDLPFLELCDHPIAIVGNTDNDTSAAWHHGLSKIVVSEPEMSMQ